MIALICYITYEQINNEKTAATAQYIIKTTAAPAFERNSGKIKRNKTVMLKNQVLGRKLKEITTNDGKEQPCYIEECPNEPKPQDCVLLNTKNPTEMSYVANIFNRNERKISNVCNAIILSPWFIFGLKKCFSTPSIVIGAGAEEYEFMSQHERYKQNVFEIKEQHFALVLLKKHFPLTKSIAHVTMDLNIPNGELEILKGNKPEQFSGVADNDAKTVIGKYQNDESVNCYRIKNDEHCANSIEFEEIKDDMNFLIINDKSRKETYLKGIGVGSWCINANRRKRELDSNHHVGSISHHKKKKGRSEDMTEKLEGKTCV